MLAFNRLELTKQALDSIRAVTRQPYELIIVDNGSTDGTSAYLDRCAREGVRVMRNEKNRCVAAAWNQGLAAAEGDCLAVISNDVVVADGWLERMIRLAYTLPGAGLVGCRASRCGGPQLLPPDYHDVRNFPDFASRHAAAADSSWFELPRVVGVLMLLRRDVYERVGSFDERFTPATFEDDDYSLRCLEAGYRNAIANDVFVHHHALNTATGDALRTGIFKQNQRRFLQKWGARAAPILAARYAGFEQHIALLRPEQYQLPASSIAVVPARVSARHLAKVGRRLSRYGLRAAAVSTFQQSLRTRVTFRGVTGLLWTMPGGLYDYWASHPAA
jgi:GT2 family glycosyltransferase